MPTDLNRTSGSDAKKEDTEIGRIRGVGKILNGIAIKACWTQGTWPSKDMTPLPFLKLCAPATAAISYAYENIHLSAHLSLVFLPATGGCHTSTMTGLSMTSCAMRCRRLHPGVHPGV